MKRKIDSLRNVLLISFLLHLSFLTFAQSFPVTGKVTDNAGKPVEGVTVQIKGGTQTSITKSDGTFSIEAPSGNAILVFSSVGFVSKEIPVDNKAQVNLALTNADNSMDNVVVIGYG